MVAGVTIAPLFPAGWNRRLVDLNVERLSDRELEWGDVGLGKSLLRQGVLARSRLAYWRFLFNTLRRHRRSLDTAMALAIMGYHLQRITETYCKS